MTVGKAIYYLLTNSTDIAAIVSTRVFPEIAQQDALLPYVVYNVTNNEPSDTKAEPSELDTANVEVNCFSTSYTESIDLAVAVRAALDRVTGTYNSVNVQSIAYMNETLNFEEAQRAYLVSSDYDVRIARTDFEIAQGSPITGVTLGELSDVEIAGVTNDQILSYDSASNTWVPATDAGGVTTLEALTDVIISNPEDGEFLKYDGGEWVNDNVSKADVGLSNVDNTTDANKPVSTAGQTALNLKADVTSVPTELRDLDDVRVSVPSNGQVLKYIDDGTPEWENAAFSIDELSDVDVTNSPANGAVLEYNSNLALWTDSGVNRLPTDGIYFHQRYETESEALRAGATATVELYFSCTAEGNGLAESASSDTPTAGNVIKRKIYYSETAFDDPATGTWVQFADLADDITFVNAKVAILAKLKLRAGGTVPIALKMTWEDTTAFQGVLDLYTGAAAGYSLRKLRGLYAGASVEVYNGTAYLDIGFNGFGELDTVALAAHCGSNDGTIRTWYDQSGNANDAAQSSTASMPKIYDGATAAVISENGKPAVKSIGTSTYMSFPPITIAEGDDFSIFVYKGTQSDWGSPITNTFMIRSNTAWRWYATGVIATGNLSDLFASYLLTSIKIGVNATVYRDSASYATISGTSGAYGDTTLRELFRGKLNNAGSQMEDGIVHEVIIYESAKSTADRSGIETNINTFYSIY